MAINNYKLNRFFTRKVLEDVMDYHTDDIYTSVIKFYVEDYHHKTNVEAIRDVYIELRRHYRNEYFYKNTLMNKLLLGKHSVNTTTALTEVPIHRSKADFVLINGKATVYEIKTELDNFERLTMQIEDYYRAFDHVAVVVSEGGLETLLKLIKEMHQPLGIYVLKRDGRIKTIREPECYAKDIDKEILFKIMRKREYEQVLSEWYGVLPDVSQFKYYQTCKKLFMDIPMERAYNRFINVLKNERSVKPTWFCRVPYELKQLVYFMDFKENDYLRLEAFLQEPFGGE